MYKNVKMYIVIHKLFYSCNNCKIYSTIYNNSTYKCIVTFIVAIVICYFL